MKLQLGELTIPGRYRVVLMLLLPAVIIVAAYFLLFDAQLREKKRLDTEAKGLRRGAPQGHGDEKQHGKDAERVRQP